MIFELSLLMSGKERDQYARGIRRCGRIDFQSHNTRMLAERQDNPVSKMFVEGHQYTFVVNRSLKDRLIIGR